MVWLPIAKAISAGCFLGCPKMFPVTAVSGFFPTQNYASENLLQVHVRGDKLDFFFKKLLHLLDMLIVAKAEDDIFPFEFEISGIPPLAFPMEIIDAA